MTRQSATEDAEPGRMFRQRGNLLRLVVAALRDRRSGYLDFSGNQPALERFAERPGAHIIAPGRGSPDHTSI